MRRTLAIVLSMVLALPACAPRYRPLMHATAPVSSQTPATTPSAVEAWRSFLGRLPAGAHIKVTLKNGKGLRATLMQLTDDTVVVNPRTRVPEPVLVIQLAELAAVELENESGTSIAKAVGIGVAAGVGAFFTILLIAITAIDD